MQINCQNDDIVVKLFQCLIDHFLKQGLYLEIPVCPITWTLMVWLKINYVQMSLAKYCSCITPSIKKVTILFVT